MQQYACFSNNHLEVLLVLLMQGYQDGQQLEVDHHLLFAKTKLPAEVDGFHEY